MTKILSFLIGAIAGFLVYGLFDNWIFIGGTFFDVKITDVLQLLVTVIIGVYVTYYINIKTSNSQKLKEIVLKRVEELLSLTKAIYANACDYIAMPTDAKGRDILSQLKDASVQISLLTKKTSDKKFKCANNCSALFINFKAAITDSPFLSASPGFEDCRKEKLYGAYNEFSQELDDLRFRLYR